MKMLIFNIISALVISYIGASCINDDYNMTISQCQNQIRTSKLKSNKN